MPFARLFLGSLLLALPLASYAQSAEPAPAPRFYAGLGLYSSYYQQLGGGAYRATRIPVQLTAGYQWRPRLAVQAGLAYSGTMDSYAGSGRYYDVTSGSSGAYYNYDGHTTQRAASVSLLARYTLTRKAAHRMQFDVAGGFGWEINRYRNYGTQSDSVQNQLVPSHYDYTGYTNRLLFILGPSVRYRFSPRLELVYDFLVNTNLASTQYNQIQGLTSSQALGLRYRFGQR